MSDQPLDPFAIPEFPPATRQIYVNRTLNLRGIKAIGYDMDYTLVHYNAKEWEDRAFWYVQQRLLDQGWPVGDLKFDHDAIIRGLIIDTELGNLLKVNRFGYVKKSRHGTRLLDFSGQRKVYSREVVDLADARYVFLNTFFSVSEAHMYALLVDMLDLGELPGVSTYGELYKMVRKSLDAAHMEGQLKADIVADPARYVLFDPDTPRTLMDQKEAGKKVLLITNSWWTFTRQMMTLCFDPYMPAGTTWRDLFDLILVAANKPAFFVDRSQLFEVINDDEMLRPTGLPLEPGKIYFGGNASLVERSLGISGSDILYVGDHVYGDVHVSKSIRRWRTGLIVRELEEELDGLEQFSEGQIRLTALMEEKVRREYRMSHLRLNRQRFANGHIHYNVDLAAFDAELAKLRDDIVSIDDQIRPLALASQAVSNPTWGMLMRAGNDKSYFARQLERHADIYMSRVSNFLFETPYVYLRSHRGSLPHDSGAMLNPYNTD